MSLLKSVAQDLVEDALLESPPVMSGRFLGMILSPSPAKPARAAEPVKELDRAKA
jgi:hypothetical protein